jgi:protein tyrosine phosphatase
MIYKKDGIKQEVRHFQYKAWPDRKCPQVGSLYTFTNVIKDNMHKGDNRGPVVVHCSAGIGRTGTFLAIDPLMDLVSQKSRVDIFARVIEMRKCRPKMVQNSVS